MSDSSKEKKRFLKPGEPVPRGWALQTEEEFERMQKQLEQESESEDDETSEASENNDTFGLELDLSWAVAIKDTEDTQHRPINENCVRRDVRYPPQLYLISYGEAEDSKCLAHLTQAVHKRGVQKSETKTILRKVIPALPNMTWFCLDEVEAKLYLVFGRVEKDFPVYYFKQFDLELGALAVVGCRPVSIADDSRDMLRIDLGEDERHTSLIPFLSPKYPTLLFYSCKMGLYDPRATKDSPKYYTRRNYMGTLHFQGMGKKMRCRAKFHDCFVSWASPFDLVFMNKGTSLAIFPIPIENYSESEREPMIQILMQENDTRGMASVRVYSLALGEQQELRVQPTLKSSVSYGQIELLESLPSGLAPSDCPKLKDMYDLESKVECFCHPYYKVFWGKVYKYGLVEYKDSGILAAKYLHKELLDGEIPTTIPNERTIFIEYLSDIFLGETLRDALDCEGIISRLVGKMGSTLYFAREHLDRNRKAIRQLDLENVLKDYRVCANCSATETNKRRRSDGKRIASFKVCRDCKKKGFHKKFRKYPCYFCSDECHRAAWEKHKFIHVTEADLLEAAKLILSKCST